MNGNKPRGSEMDLLTSILKTLEMLFMTIKVKNGVEAVRSSAAYVTYKFIMSCAKDENILKHMLDNLSRNVDKANFFVNVLGNQYKNYYLKTGNSLGCTVVYRSVQLLKWQTEILHIYKWTSGHQLNDEQVEQMQKNLAYWKDRTSYDPAYSGLDPLVYMHPVNVANLPEMLVGIHRAFPETEKFEENRQIYA